MNLLILGAGNAQVDAIQYLKKKGHFVHVLSYKDEGSVRKEANRFSIIDIVNKNRVLEYAQQNGVDLVYSIGSDAAIITIAYVSDRLRLPHFVDEKTALIMQNKGFFRSFLTERQISVVDFVICKSIDDLNDWSLFPAIIKPVDSQGQRGVMKVSDREELLKYFDHSLRFSASKNAIVEKYIDGKEVSINAYIYQGDCKYTFVTDRNVVKGFPGGIPRSHGFPSVMPTVMLKEADTLIKQTIKAFNIQNGPVYFQMKYNNEGVFILEATPRLDGCHLWRLIQNSCGVDLLDLTFTHLLCPENLYFIKPSKKQDHMLLEFFLEKPNEIFSMKKINFDDHEYVKFYYKDGELITPVNGFMEKTGYKIVKEA